jgi:hypothetical protein
LKPRIFIGSSTEHIAVADAAELNLANFADAISWKHAFKPGHNFLADLLKEAKRCDFALLILTADDVLTSRGIEYRTPRDNILFEMGLFIGELGPDRVFALLDDTIDTKILSDYAGISPLTYNGKRTTDELSSAVSPACTQIKTQASALGCRESARFQAAVDKDLMGVGIREIYPNYNLEEPEILNEMSSSSGPTRLFFQIASQSVNVKGTLFDVLEEVVRRSQVEVRVLHAGVNSPLFAPGRLLALGKHPGRILASLRYVDDSLRELRGYCRLLTA